MRETGMRGTRMRQVTLAGTRRAPPEQPTRGGFAEGSPRSPQRRGQPREGPGSRRPAAPAPLTVRLLHGALVQALVVGQRGDVGRGQQLGPRPVEPGLLPRQHHGEAPGLCAGGGRPAPLRRRAEPGAGTAGTARPHGGAGWRPCSGACGLGSLLLVSACFWCPGVGGVPLLAVPLCQWCALVCLVLSVSGVRLSAASLFQCCPVSVVTPCQPCPLSSWCPPVSGDRYQPSHRAAMYPSLRVPPVSSVSLTSGVPLSVMAILSVMSPCHQR